VLSAALPVVSVMIVDSQTLHTSCQGIPVIYYNQAVQFLRDVRSEVRKVTFPSRKETVTSTIVVIMVVFVVSIYLGIVDFGLSIVLSSILR